MSYSGEIWVHTAKNCSSVGAKRSQREKIYAGVKREKELIWAERDVMQGLTSAPGTQANQPARKIMTYTIMCFSLAGLIFGFAAGGFCGRTPHPNITASN